MINLCLAIFWLITAVVLFFVEQSGTGKGLLAIRLDVAALCLALYNLVRWWSMRIAQSQRQQGEVILRKPSLRRPGDDVIAPDPNFVFTDPPPAAPPQPGSNGVSEQH